MSTAVAVPAPRALKFGAFQLTADGLRVVGRPEFSDYEQALGAASYLGEKAPFWKADLLEYGHNRKEWAGLIEAVVDAEKFTAATVSQYRYVARSVPAENRVEGLSFSHHEKVAPLSPADQRRYLKRAKQEHLSVAELTQVIKKEQHKAKRVIRGQAAELSALHAAVADAAYDASQACKAIPRDDGKDAYTHLRAARTALDTCEAAIKKLKAAQGKPS